MHSFQKINPNQWDKNIFYSLDKQWMLIAAGNKEKHNMMTASWGGFGILWNYPVAFIFVRPTRHTYSFVEENEYFSLNFFEYFLQVP